MTPKQIRHALELAMKDKTPQQYAAMKADGTLAAYLNRLTADVQASQTEAHNALANDPQFQKISDPQTRTQEASSRLKAAESVAIEQAVEQISSLQAPQQTTASTPAT